MRIEYLLVVIISAIGSCSQKDRNTLKSEPAESEPTGSGPIESEPTESEPVESEPMDSVYNDSESDRSTDSGQSPFDSDTSTEAVDSDSDSGSESESMPFCPGPEVKEECADGFCKIPSGCYVFGSPPTEAPDCRAFACEDQVQVTLTRPFLIAETEVTQAQWEEMGFANPSLEPLCSNCPVSMISWAETLVYLNALSKKEGFEPCYDLSLCEGVVGGGCIGTDDVCSSDDFTCRGDVNRHANPYDCEGYRLPTNAEWQLAARAGTSTATYNGDLANNSSSIGDCVTDEVANEAAWDCSNASQVMPVGLKKRNDFGLYDMIGNVREWCADPWRNVRLGGGADDLVDPYGFVQDESAGSRVTSGGSWMDPSCLSRSASNGGWPSILRIANIGFRPVRTLVE